MKKIILSTITLSIVALCSCFKSNVFEKNQSIPNNAWKNSYKPSFEFEISDTSTQYRIYLTIRHTDAYPFSNLWLNISTTMPGDSHAQQIRTEIPLSQEDGKWLGRMHDEICTQQLSLTKNGTVRFDKLGRYKIKLEQIMRQNPLPEVMSVGIRLEKIEKR